MRAGFKLHTMAERHDDVFENMIEEFCGITHATPDEARLIIRKNNFILQDAILDFFDNGAKSLDSIKTSDDAFKEHQNLSLPVQHPNQSSDCKELNLKLITWNIDGLDQRDLKLRTLAVAFQINSLNPDVVFLQEVIPETLELIKRSCKSYTIYHHIRFGYFCAILIKTSPLLQFVSKSVFEYPESRMGRYLMSLHIKFNGHFFTLMTTHLESTKDAAKERKQQLLFCLQEMEESKQDSHVIFAGDLNIRDQEMISIGGLPDEIKDAWIESGSDSENKFTWDVNTNDNLDWKFNFRPKIRFDRMFYASNGMSKVKAESFKLIGKDRLESCGRFASDHWGIICEFKISK